MWASPSLVKIKFLKKIFQKNFLKNFTTREKENTLRILKDCKNGDFFKRNKEKGSTKKK